MLREEKTLRISFVMAAVLFALACAIPVVGFVLYALWPVRVLVAWLVLGAIGLVIAVWLILWVVRATTAASVAVREEALRPGRLYANERLVSEAWEYPAPSTQYQRPQQGYEQMQVLPYDETTTWYQ